MTTPSRKHRLTRTERFARAAIGMPVGHPELITRRPSRAEWRYFAGWAAQMWPHDEYSAIVTDAWRQNRP